MAYTKMSHSMFANVKMAVARAVGEALVSFDRTLNANRDAATFIPTTTVSRVVRVNVGGGTEYRAFTVAVSVTEIAFGSVAGASPAATDDFVV